MDYVIDYVSHLVDVGDYDPLDVKIIMTLPEKPCPDYSEGQVLGGK